MRRLISIPCALLLLACPSDDAGVEDETADPPATDTASGDDSAALGCAVDIEHDTSDGAAGDVQQTWGSACASDDDCVAVLGAGAVCLFEAVIYELPLGYCSKPCTLDPDEGVRMDDPTCDPAGGVDCIGNNAVGFQYCAVACTDDGQCSRDGYTCRQMPMIAMEGDPSYCLMPDCCDGLSCAN